MTSQALAAALCALVAVAALGGIAVHLTSDGTSGDTSGTGGGWRRGRRHVRRLDRVTQRRMLVAGVAGLAVWVAAGWLAGGVATAAAVLVLPLLLGSRAERHHPIERLEALHQWTHNLSGVLHRGQGLEQAIQASLRATPALIRPEVSRLVTRLHSGWTGEAALRQLAEDLHDPSGDVAAVALMTGAAARDTDLATVLKEIAETMAEEVAMRRRIDAAREDARTSSRYLTLMTIALIVIAPLVSSGWRGAYSDGLGQVVFAVLFTAFLAALAWSRKMSVGAPSRRVLFSEAAPKADAR